MLRNTTSFSALIDGALLSQMSETELASQMSVAAAGPKLEAEFNAGSAGSTPGPATERMAVGNKGTASAMVATAAAAKHARMAGEAKKDDGPAKPTRPEVWLLTPPTVTSPGAFAQIVRGRLVLHLIIFAVFSCWTVFDILVIHWGKVGWPQDGYFFCNLSIVLTCFEFAYLMYMLVRYHAAQKALGSDADQANDFANTISVAGNDHRGPGAPVKYKV